MTRKSASTPPYVPKKGLRAILDHIQGHAKGQVLSREELHRRGLSSHWTYPAMAALRFFSILDDEDKLTGKHAIFSRESPDLPAQQALLRESYSDFFGTVKLPLASPEELRATFQATYDLSDRVTNSAFPIFQALCEEAGMVLTGPADAVPEGEGDSEDLLRRLSSEEGFRIRHAGYQVVINLQVTKYTTEKDLMKMIKTANRAVHLMKKSGDRNT
jgi:hypothetical protein